MGKNLPKLKRGFHYDIKSKELGIYIDGTQAAGYSEAAGRTFYVNNITGSSTNNGRSWGNAFAEISEAITAVEAYQDTMDTGNEYLRNTILVQGTSTAYEALTSLAGYTNYVGIGAEPWGLGGGIARIDGEGTAAACAVGSDTVRGWNLYNLQFMQSSDGAVYGLDINDSAYRIRIEHCGFCNNGTAGIHIKSVGSMVMDDCKTVQDQFYQDYGMLVGSTSGSTGNFNSCTISDSYFTGTTTALLNYNNSCGGTWIHDCIFVGGGHGFQELSNGANGDIHNLRCTDCYGSGTHGSSLGSSGFEVTTNPEKRFFRCSDIAQGASFQFPTMDMEYS